MTNRIKPRICPHCGGILHAELTEREDEIARLAASGLRNQRIAEQLFIGESTVRWNLLKVFAKLGIKNRSQLPGLLKEKHG